MLPGTDYILIGLANIHPGTCKVSPRCPSICLNMVIRAQLRHSITPSFHPRWERIRQAVGEVLRAPRRRMGSRLVYWRGQLVRVTKLSPFEKTFWPNGAFSLSQAQICPDFWAAVWKYEIEMGKIDIASLCLGTACNGLGSVREVLPAEGCLFWRVRVYMCVSDLFRMLSHDWPIRLCNQRSFTLPWRITQYPRDSISQHYNIAKE